MVFKQKFNCHDLPPRGSVPINWWHGRAGQNVPSTHRKTAKRKGGKEVPGQAHQSLPPNPGEKLFLGEREDKGDAGHLKV